MSPKRILLIHDDRVLANLYSEKLLLHKFTIETSRTLDHALKVCANSQPDLILLDLVLQGGNALGFLEGLRSNPATAEIPILILPTVLTQLGQSALHAGATSLIIGGKRPAASVVSAVNTAFGLAPLDEATSGLLEPDPAWNEQVFGTVPEALNQMRQCLPGLVASMVDMQALHTLWALVHGFAERMALTTFQGIAQIAAGFDIFMAELNESPEQVNSNTSRTVGQVLDLLTLLSLRANQAQIKDTTTSYILIVDDEASARQFITAAMHLVGLNNEAVATPSEALEKLKARPAQLIILDVGLPEMNGFELCTKIRAFEQHKKTPIVFLTGMNTFQNKAQASLSGGNDFIGKPFILSELGLKALVWLFRGQLGKV